GMINDSTITFGSINRQKWRKNLSISKKVKTDMDDDDLFINNNSSSSSTAQDFFISASKLQNLDETESIAMNHNEEEDERDICNKLLTILSIQKEKDKKF
ncbi:31160_t:CDS:2, partial [Racocetra persica]